MSALLVSAILFCNAASGQSFDAADVHNTTNFRTSYARISSAPGGRHEFRSASLADLIHIGYGIDADKILGGPTWLKAERFDVIAKAPEATSAEDVKAMLQSLLSDRFNLVFHRDIRPFSSYVLTAGPKPKIRQSAGPGVAGCKAQGLAGSPPQGGGRVSIDGGNTTVVVGPDRAVLFQCRSVSMSEFAAGLNTMPGVTLGNDAVVDRTGLKGSWDFDVRWSVGAVIATPEEGGGTPISIFEAIDKQLGLKLDKQPVPAPVFVVDSVNEKPTGNPPGTAEALPEIALPAKFDVADIKLSDPNSLVRKYEMQPGGRVVIRGMQMSFLLSRALIDLGKPVEGLPGWVATARYDITAKVAETSASMSIEMIGGMLRSLLTERFKLATHDDNRPLPYYALVITKPKLLKGNPAEGADCTSPVSVPGPMPAFLTINCRNTTMEQFANQLPKLSGGAVNMSVTDSTGLEGAWDFSVKFSSAQALRIAAISNAQATRAAQGAPEPDETITIFEALNKQLGLKLEERKKLKPVIVIDHLEEKPTEE